MTKIIFTLTFLLCNLAVGVENTDFLVKIENQINNLIEDKIQLIIEKEQLEEQIREIQSKIKAKKSLVLKRLKASHSLKKFKWGELLLNSNINELDRNLKILNSLNKYDYDLFRDYNSSLRLLVLSRKNLQETEQLILKNVENLKNQQAEFHELESAKIENLNKQNIKSLLVYKGELARPIEGLVKSEYGSIKDRDNRFYLINKGELYSTKQNSFVKTVGPGKLIFRDLLARWRETLIIEHDDNYYSVYAGIKNSKIDVGSEVVQNEIIGNAAGDEVYFELRHFDNPINPKSWFKELK
jgi:murein DD-endopeptidase MepM/ murein hydrolase activator NlpD